MDLVTIISIVASLLLGGVFVVATVWGRLALGTRTLSALSVLQRILLGLSKTRSASGPELFSDDHARFMQLAHILTDLVPKILLDVLTNHITSNTVFQNRCDKKPWDGGQEHRKWLASVMEMNPRVKDFSCAAVRNKPASEWDVTNLSAALSAVMEPSGVPCDVDVNQWCGRKTKKPMEYFEVDVGKSERADCKSWEGFSINVTGASPPEIVECVVTEAPSETMVVAVSREKAKDRDLPNKIKKSDLTEVRPVNLPLPEVQDIVKVRQSRNALYHRSKTEVSGDEFTQCVASVRHLIEQAFPKEVSDGYLAELDTAADTEKFKEWITNGKNATEERQILEHMKEELQEQGEQGKELRMGIEALLEGFSERIEAVKTKLQGLQDVMQCEHADIQRRQEHQLKVTKQGQEVNQRGQDVIKHGQEVIQCRQQQHVEVTEHVLAVVQGLERGQEYISRQLEPRETKDLLSQDRHQQDDTSILGQKPSFLLLKKNVVPRVSANWKALGLNLDIKDSCLLAIEKNKPHQPEACCTEMFSMWLGLAPHTGGLPLTWSSVLSAVGKVDSATSEELLAELKSGVEAHRATLRLACELEAYYNRLEAVVGDRFTPKLEFAELAVVERQKYGLRKKNFEEFLHATVYGIDEIYEKSHPVQYCEILTLVKGPTSGKHIIISGAPGSGKTTLVRRLCKDLSSGRLRSGYTLVVLVELRELILFLQDKEEAQLRHFLAKFKHRLDIDQVCRELEESDGRGVLLVLDGFDELDARMRGCQLLKKLLSTESIYLPDCDILVTSRPVTCPDLLGLMQPLHRHIEILGFSEDCIASFIRSYYKCTCQPPPSQPAPSKKPAEGGCEAEKLLSHLAQLPQVKGMCRTPVVLKMVCKVFELLGDDDLPATMTGIYEEFIRRQLLENGPEDVEISSILHVPSIDYPFFGDLCKIAFECCAKQKLTISREEIDSTPPPFTRGSIYGLLYADPVVDLRTIRELPLYHFMHKTVQEALAACHLAVLPNPKSHEEVWRDWFGRPEMAEVWRCYAGLTGFNHVDISSIVPLAVKAGEAIHTLLVISLFEAGNASLAREELPRIFPRQLVARLHTSYETAVYAFALQHHPSLEGLLLDLSRTTGSVNLQLLLDALSHHPTARELYVGYLDIVAGDRAALCQFLRGKHRLAKVELHYTPVEVAVAAFSTESSTMEELEWTCLTIPELLGDDATGNLLYCLRSTSLRCITVKLRGRLGKVLLPILRGLASNIKIVDRTVMAGYFPLDPPLVSQLAAELRHFLVPCVKCDLSVPLPVGVWGTLLSGVGDARQLAWLRVVMCGNPEDTGLEWDEIDQSTLEEVKKSWAHSKCREVDFEVTDPVRGSTVDATMKLLCAVVGGIIQRKDQFVLKLQVMAEQVSRLEELEDNTKNKCAVTRTERGHVTVLELKPHSSDQKGKSSSSQPPASPSRQSVGQRQKNRSSSF